MVINDNKIQRARVELKLNSLNLNVACGETYNAGVFNFSKKKFC